MFKLTRAIQLLTFTALICGLSLQVSARESEQEDIRKPLVIDETVADFTLRSREHGNIRLNELRGNVVLVSFWASWSSSSTRIWPEFESLYHSKQKEGFTILSINIDPENSEETLAKKTVSFPILFDDRKSVTKKFSVNIIPSFYLIDRSGQVKLILEGHEPSYASIIKNKVDELLANEELASIKLD